MRFKFSWTNPLIAACRHPTIGRLVPRALVFAALRRFGQDHYDVTVNGAIMRLHPFDSRIERRLLLRPLSYCPAEREFLRAALASGGVYVDAGANVGAMCLPFAAIPGVRVLAIEPSPIALARLRHNVAANGFSNVEVATEALDDHEGSVGFELRHDNIGLSRVGPADTRVTAAPLASVLKAHGIDRIDVLKIDVEGWEDQVLLPYFASVDPALWPSVALVEVGYQGRMPASIADMVERGYRVIFNSHQNLGLSRVGHRGVD